MSIFDLYEGIYSPKKKEPEVVILPRTAEAVEWLRKGYKIWEIADKMMVTEPVVVAHLRTALRAGVIGRAELWKAYVPNWLWDFAVKNFPLKTWKYFDETMYLRQLAILKWRPLSNELAKQYVREGLLKLVTGEGRIGIEKRYFSPIMAMYNMERVIVDYATELWGTTTYTSEVRPREIYYSGETHGLKVAILCKDWRRILGFRSDVARWIYEEVGFKATPEQFDYFMRTWGHAVRSEKVRVIVPIQSSEEEIEFVEEVSEAMLIVPPKEW